MKRYDLRILLLVSVLLASAATVHAIIPCCAIKLVNKVTGVVTGIENASGREFQFKVSPELMRSLHPGQAVYANFRTHLVSLDGQSTGGKIIAVGPMPTVRANTPQPTAGISSRQPGSPQAAVVTRQQPGIGRPRPSLQAGIKQKTTASAQAAPLPQAAPLSPCCSITAINNATGVVTAQDKTTGKTFQVSAGS